MRIGIFFGGPSREREISFAGGRTVYDNLDKELFEAIPIFVDSLGHLILLDWQFLYKGTIRDFYPPVEFLKESNHNFQVYIESLNIKDSATLDQLIEKIGQKVDFTDLSKHIDFAFLALHGLAGEDGSLQGMLELLDIPYSGSGIRSSAIGMDKSFQKKIMEAGGFHCPAMFELSRGEWMENNKSITIDSILSRMNFPLVVRPANQGSSIGVSILQDQSELSDAIDAAFFIKNISREQWTAFHLSEKVEMVKAITDIRTGIGFPLFFEGKSTIIHHPNTLLHKIESFFDESQQKLLKLEGFQSDTKVIIEAFIEGKEFSCIVIKDVNGKSIALPPTEIIKGNEVFDYRSKYLPGLSRKLTPIQIREDYIENIRNSSQRLFEFLEFETYARIDGFIEEDGKIYLNDPNTTSGMLPSSFFFHQAAEIGLNPSQFLSYIIRTSIQERINNSTRIGLYENLLEQLDKGLEQQFKNKEQNHHVGIIMGGYSSERHISVESGRNIFEKISSSKDMIATPIFLLGDQDHYKLFKIPVNLMLKDNADDIKDKILNYEVHPIIEKIRKEASNITLKFAGKNSVDKPELIKVQDLNPNFDSIFIALHGRPGEDGNIQGVLEQIGMPYNGSISSASKVTINKYETLQKLKNKGFVVTEQQLINKETFLAEPISIIQSIEKIIPYPLIAKPVDDGCSSAVKKIYNRDQLLAFLKLIFRNEDNEHQDLRAFLQLKHKEEFPMKEIALIEALIDIGEAVHFLEITGGLLTRFDEKGNLIYEIFEPSEALSSSDILSLEEKFLAGEGQNITPARFITDEYEYDHDYISKQVRATLEKAARILNITGYARIDAFVRVFQNGKVETIIIEVNSLPGMTPATCIFHQCALSGYKPDMFIKKILKFGLEREKRKQVKLN